MKTNIKPVIITILIFTAGGIAMIIPTAWDNLIIGGVIGFFCEKMIE